MYGKNSKDVCCLVFNRTLCLLLWNLLIGTMVISLEYSATNCNCIRVKDCLPFATLLLNHESHEQAAIFAYIRKAGCGFQGEDALACCPANEAYGQFLYSNSKTEAPQSTFSTVDQLQVWDKRASPTADDKDVTNRFSTFDRSPFGENVYKLDAIDYKDTKTDLNFPQLFYEKRYEDPTYRAKDDRYNFRVGHDFDDTEFTPNSRSADAPKVRTTFDGPIIFPDDERLNRPIIFPTDNRKGNSKPKSTPTVSSSTVKVKTSRGSTGTCEKVNDELCGVSVNQRILGGFASAPGQFPWIRRIGYLNKTSNRISYRCSGSVISNSFILTAAHCVANLVDGLKVSHISTGGADSGEARKCGRRKRRNCSQTSRTFEIKEVIVHPLYDQPKYSNDIALLKIQAPESNSASICLPPNDRAVLADRLIGTTGVVAGWSTTNKVAETNEMIRYLRLPIVNNTECANTYARFSENFNDDPIVITSSQLCAQGMPLNDACRGDSGGPFMDEGTSGVINTNGRYTILGVVAFGPTTCGVANFPGVYTRVSSYVDWIVSNLC